MAKRMDLTLHKAREITCRGGRQCAYYGDWYMTDERGEVIDDGRERPVASPGVCKEDGGSPDTKGYVAGGKLQVKPGFEGGE